MEKRSLLDKIKAQFKTTIPEDYDLEFDICMKCGRRLEDKKYSSLKKHQIIAHPVKRKSKLREMFFKYPTTSVFIIMFIAILGITTLAPPLIEYVVEPTLIYFGFEMADQIDVEKCTEDLIAIKQDLHESQNFGNEHVQEFNRLLKECNVDFMGVTQDVSIFEQDRYKKP